MNLADGILSIDTSAGFDVTNLRQIQETVERNHVDSIKSSDVDLAIHVPDYIRTLKTLEKQITTAKKEVEAPLKVKKEETKKAYEDASELLKSTVEPYNTTKSSISSEIDNLRSNLSEYVENKAKADQAIIDQAKAALVDNSNLINQAKEAYLEGNDDAADKLVADAEKSLDTYYDLQDYKIGKIETPGTSFSSYIDIEIVDPSIIPTSFMIRGVSIDKLIKAISAQYPGIYFEKISIVDESLIDNQFFEYIPDTKNIIAYLKADESNVVPGVNKLIKQRPIIRY